jgi:hypothetical protein
MGSARWPAVNELILQLTPPLLLNAVRSLRRWARGQGGTVTSLRPAFDPEALQLYDSRIRLATRYLEYGCGGSTIYALNKSSCSVTSVDTSKPWIDKVLSAAGPAAARLTIEYVDIGPIRELGIPENYASRSAFPKYVQQPWHSMANPDLVLVDGRFRVACFLHSLLLAPLGTQILFDDYVRPDYHVVEEIVQPHTKAGRMAMFTVPADFDRSAAQRLRDAFLIVWK